jgi:hypothetical protein
VAERLFLFVQMEFPWELGLADGRYLLRTEGDREPERVVVLDTLGAARHGPSAGATRRRGPATWRRPRVEPEPEPRAVVVTRATTIDPVSVSAEGQARAWLTGVDVERETRTAAGALNRMIAAHRIATADPYVREISPAQALVIRAGWGDGEQVAYGQWLHARELRLSDSRARRRAGGRAAAMRPQERLAALLAARQQPLACEELTLRARLDLDEGRLALAAIELDRAYAAALIELPAEERAELSERLGELAQLNPGVVRAAHHALSAGVERPDAEAVEHALGRLEAALRARAAAGFGH